MAAVNMSGVILVTCDGKQCQNIKESKSKLKAVTSAFIVDKQTPDAPDVIITMDNTSKDYQRGNANCG